MALWRIKRPEGLKEYSPQGLGRVLGLDRAPEVKTLRRKLARLAATGRAAQFGTRPGSAAGRLARSSPGIPLRRRPCAGLPRPTPRCPRPTWPACASPCPPPRTIGSTTRRAIRLFVVTAEANAGLVKMLPGILAQIRALVGQRRLTVVFDRGGFSPKLFQQTYWPPASTCSPIARAAIPESRAGVSAHAEHVVNGRDEHLRLGRPGGALAQGQAATAAGHPPDGQRPSNPDPDFAAGFARRASGLSNV